jgi:hypothetical protein
MIAIFRADGTWNTCDKTVDPPRISKSCMRFLILSERLLQYGKLLNRALQPIAPGCEAV